MSQLMKFSLSALLQLSAILDTHTHTFTHRSPCVLTPSSAHKFSRRYVNTHTHTHTHTKHIVTRVPALHGTEVVL